jgi:Flp pilus assembly protein TadG
MVEFALLAPIFVALILGVVEMGTAVDNTQLLTSAIREGGRLATMDWSGTLPQGTTANDKVIKDIRNFLTAAGLDGSKIEINIESAEGSDAGQTFDLSKPANNLRLFKISAKVPFKDSTSFPATLMKNRDVSASLTFRAGRTNLVN